MKNLKLNKNKTKQKITPLQKITNRCVKLAGNCHMTQLVSGVLGEMNFFPVPVQVSDTTNKPEEKGSRHRKMNGVAPNVDRIPQETLIQVPTAGSLRTLT